MNRRVAIIVAIAVALAVGLFSAPRRYEVDGVSMGPALLPGDIVTTGWLPDLDRRRGPRRFDRWIVRLPDGSTGLKRVTGLPGETVSFVSGDLAIDDEIVLKSPRQLATIGSRVGSSMPDGGRAWASSPATVLDDAPFASGEVSRLLLPVRDVGYTAIITLAARGTAVGSARIKAAAGPLAVTWRLQSPGRYAVAVGRLDGHAVAAAWPLPAGSDAPAADRACLPPGAPDRWDVRRPWPEAQPAPAGNAADARSPSLALDLVVADNGTAVIDHVDLWRDALLRPAADGVAAWQLGPDEVFVLGDFPSGSRDSRHFGPLPPAALRHWVRRP